MPFFKILKIFYWAQFLSLDLNSRDALVTNAGKLTALLDGGTATSSGFTLLNHEKAKADFVLLISDNQSWTDTAQRGTATMREWEALRARNPQARLACVDLQPYSTVQATPGQDVLHVGGFSDAVFDVLASYASGQMDSDFWVKEIEQTEL
jgi:60 kDa SS-A/Ro ribonucleoprotein